MISRFSLVLFFLVSYLTVIAQNSRETNSQQQRISNDLLEEELFAPTLPGTGDYTRDYKKRKRKRQRKVKKLSYGNAIDEYRMRMQAVAKRNEKQARMARKPRYSDPTYFGHKRPPKKRPVGKRKLCKECMIVH